MRVIVDTNVVLDVLLARKPFVSAAVQLFGLIERGQVEGMLCATSVTTLDDLLTQSCMNNWTSAIADQTKETRYEPL